MLRKLIVGSNSKFLGTAVKIILVRLKIGRLGEKSHYPYRVRVILAESVPQVPFVSDELIQSDLISIMIPCVEKDLPFLPTCIEGVNRNVQNSIDKISVITNCPELVRSVVGPKIEIITEVDFLPKSIRTFISDNIPKSIQGWVTKQIIVMYFAYESVLDGVLTIDADTILLSPRKFLNGEKQVIIPVVEYAYHDAITSHKTWKTSGISLGISFKAHHMLMKPKVVREMFDSLGGFERGSLDWLSSTLNAEWLPFSEFHSYATWILNRYPDQVELARWGNVRASRSIMETNLYAEKPIQLYDFIENYFPTYNSVSFHHYLPDDFVELKKS